MVTYLELGSEPVWGQQITPPNMLEALVKPLRAFYGMGPALIGAPGDNNHLRGRHRSRDWDLTSRYCTNRSYATTDSRDKDGHGGWYRAVDVGITGQTLYAASQRMDTLVRSGADGGRVAEWFGTFDGRTVVGWFEGHAATSSESHLYHLHVGVWTRYADDISLMGLLYRTITGTNPEGDDMGAFVLSGFSGQPDSTQGAYHVADASPQGYHVAPREPGWNATCWPNAPKMSPGAPVPTKYTYEQVLTVLFGPPRPAGGGTPAGPVDVSDESLARIRTIVDEELDEQSLGGADVDQ